MKIRTIYLIALVVLIFLNACRDEKLNESIFDTSPPQRNQFDTWIYSTLVKPYNIDLKYRHEDIEKEAIYNLVPADQNKAYKLAQIIKLGWIDVYDDLVKQGFVRENAPKVIQLVGSPAYNSDGSETLANADAAIQITLFNVNGLKEPIDQHQINTNYFRIMHHEFAHILHQKKAYDLSFARISNSQYVKGQWIEYPYNIVWIANQNGFVSSYAMSYPDEDFAETFSIYLSYSDLDWANLLEQAGEEGSAIIIEKLNFIRLYFKNKWKIDIDILKGKIQNKAEHLKNYQLDEID